MIAESCVRCCCKGDPGRETQCAALLHTAPRLQAQWADGPISKGESSHMIESVSPVLQCHSKHDIQCSKWVAFHVLVGNQLYGEVHQKSSKFVKYCCRIVHIGERKHDAVD